MSEYTDRFNCSDLLAWGKAKHAGGVQTGYTDNRDELDTLLFEVPNGSVREMREWLYANRLHDSDFDTPWRNYAGPWRLVRVEDKSNRDFVQLFVTIGRGYYTTPDWTAARLAGREKSPSNDNANLFTVASIDSAADAKTHMVEFRFVDPKNVAAFEDAISDSYTDPIVGTQTLNGTYKSLYSTSKIVEDGSATVTLVLADSQYVLSAYASKGGVNQDDVVYLWQVPEGAAQGIINDWAYTHPLGSGATANYQANGHVVDITLRKPALLGESLTVSGFEIKCDTTVSYAVIFGVSAADAQTFIDNRKTIATQPGNQAKGGVKREIEWKPRGDGLWDVIITTYYTAYDAGKHKFQVQQKQGGGDSILVEYGWEVPIAQLAVIEADYNTASAGETKKLEITKNEDRCNFSYVGTVVTAGAREATLAAAGSAGVAFSHASGFGAVSLPSLTAAKRVQHQLKAVKDEAGRYTYTVDTVTVQENEDHATSGGTSGVKETIYAGKNTDAGDLATALTSIGATTPRKHVTIEHYPNDDKTWNYVVKAKDLFKSDGGMSIPAAASPPGPFGGSQVGIITGTNVLTGELAAIVTNASAVTGAGRAWTVDVSPEEDGRFSYVMKWFEKNSAQLTSEEFLDPRSTDLNVKLGATNAEKTIIMLDGVSKDAFDKTLTTGPSYTNDAQLEIGDDGKISGFVSRIRKLPKTGSATARTQINGIKIQVEVSNVENAASIPAGISDFTNGIEERFEDVSENDDDTFNYRYIKTTYSIATGYLYVPATEAGLFYTKRSKVTERRRETIYSEFVPVAFRDEDLLITRYKNLFVTSWIDYERDVTMEVQQAYSLGPATLPSVAQKDDTIYEQKEIEGTAGIWVVTKTTLTYDDWTENLGWAWWDETGDPDHKDTGPINPVP